VFQFGLNWHVFSKLSPLFVFSISVVKLINQSFDLYDRLAFKMNIYHKLKVSYIIRHVIIKHALVKELMILQVQNDDIKP
jgi:hypothetical protein